jgi:5-methylcytosine-specific restriction enzyme A
MWSCCWSVCNVSDYLYGLSMAGEEEGLIMAMLKMCRCGKPIPISIARCNSCQEKYDKDPQVKDLKKKSNKEYDLYKRDKRSSAFYKSKAWQLLRLSALSRDNYLCQHCIKEKKIRPAMDVDHIVPIKVNWELRLSLDNLQSLCRSCHNQKTKKESKG